mmetsp:Transcript_9766/g.12187  ORF Transcript_9766/g.12187 Transcript_9766/m.12187 type:complete len:403 (-) Transcript_9766:598-1806(-)
MSKFQLLLCCLLITILQFYSSAIVLAFLEESQRFSFSTCFITRTINRETKTNPFSKNVNKEDRDNGKITQVPIDELQSLCHQAVEKLGYSSEDAAQITEVLMYAELRGNDQGVAKVFSPVLEHNEAEGQIEVSQKSLFSFSLNGNQRVGAVVVNKATELAIKTAETFGVGIAGTFNTGPASGALGYYLQKITGQGLIGVILAQSAEYVAPHGSSEPIFGTNPLAVGIPRANDTALIVDMSTAAMSVAGVKEARSKGASLPDGVAFDADGNPTTNPTEALSGALRTFDRSYKSSHLALIVEILGGLWPGGNALNKHASRNCGTLVAAFKPDILGDSGEFLQKIEEALTRIKNSRMSSNMKIQLPGENSHALFLKSIDNGYVGLGFDTYRSLLKMLDSSDSVGE